MSCRHYHRHFWVTKTKLWNFRNFDVMTSCLNISSRCFLCIQNEWIRKAIKKIVWKTSNPQWRRLFVREIVVLYFGYVGELTKTINKIDKSLVNNDDSKINNYDNRLEETLSKIHYVTTKLKNLIFKNRKESEQVLEFCTEQEFRVINIRRKKYWAVFHHLWTHLIAKTSGVWLLFLNIINT